ncbi:thiosulfate oxidation carrier protein SoxY [Bathymodiolus japonicus methanotrophic gill symbiont]|uniref:thiosulfate oxidation carrier protein SoxY n=1 Tax=Bathymodiolus japonicus methanotrophic gill symbiont TaxID=113269 RepID=UPI001C8EE7C1|nr:thiosulfate oxidation carrier protein SoxY [Bathymodiolus japonicus methanotrophic gill symbiont]
MLSSRRKFLTNMLTLVCSSLALIFSKTDKIKLKLPRIAENGSVVPITITSNIQNSDTVYIFSEKTRCL